jgi:UDP-N-acetyl-D-glucosamine/UDP-N-acetyl-D-galactosamine dehydrogenase
MNSLSDIHICVVGLGYVGLPLAVALSKQFTTMGFDIDANRVLQISNGIDVTQEVDKNELLNSSRLSVTANVDEIISASVYIITVPTPIDENRQPDLTPLISASETVGGVIASGNVVIYESTVFPGATEELCVPMLEQSSGLKFNQQFFVGYSPERINPGDKDNKLANILKVTSGSTPEIADFVDEIYSKIIHVGTYKAASIKVAEAAKVIENTQRDLNIALINELAIIFDKLGLDTLDVLEAAATKWNFQPYKPGLVGGHCIGVDPYYLTHKAQSVGYYPDVILAGRRINSGMGEYVADKLIRNLIARDFNVRKTRVLLLGFSFKENCPDTRNTKVIDVYRHLSSFEIEVSIYDPYVDTEVAKKHYDVDIDAELTVSKFDSIMLCVAHDQFRSQQDLFLNMLDPNGFVFDLKGIFKKSERVVRL